MEEANCSVKWEGKVWWGWRCSPLLTDMIYCRICSLWASFLSSLCTPAHSWLIRVISMSNVSWVLQELQRANKTKRTIAAAGRTLRGCCFYAGPAHLLWFCPLFYMSSSLLLTLASSTSTEWSFISGEASFYFMQNSNLFYVNISVLIYFPQQVETRWFHG